MFFGLGTYFLLSQLCASITLILDILTFQFKKRETILIFIIFSTVFLSLHYFFLSKTLAAVILMVSLCRFITSYFTTHRGALVFFLCANVFVLYFTYREVSDLLPFVVSTLFTLGAFQKDDRTMRQFFIVASSFLFFYDFVIFSPMGMVLESVFVVSSIAGYWKFYYKKTTTVAKK